MASKGEAVFFNGIKFYRYPNSKTRSNQLYFRPGKQAHNNGIQTLHQEVWKFYNGKIPKGHAIHHKDHNPLNNDISNLELVPRGQHQKEHCAHRINKNKNEWVKFQKRGTEASIAAYKSRPHRKENCVVCGKQYTTNYTQRRLYCGNTCRSKNQKLPTNKKFHR